MTTGFDVRVVADADAAEAVDAAVEQRRIEAEYTRQLGRVAKEQATAMLVAVCRSVGGTPINPDGGVYFIPDAGMARWRIVAEAVEKAAGGGCRVQHLTAVRDPDTVRAIADGFVADMESRLDRMADELNEKGARAAMNRGDECIALADLAEAYASVLGDAHARVLGRIAEVQARATQAVMRQDAVESGTGSSLADQL